jgi:alkylation response protein AidB-like acyl-CoA dehydrogenase
MDLELSAEDVAFRDEVRAFLDSELTPELREAGRRCCGIYAEYGPANAWHSILARRGWSTPHWPVEHGGTGWTPFRHYIFQCELARADAPPLPPNSTHMVAPVVMAFGSEAQKARYLPAIRSGDDWWAQGYSEPGAGSDLASLRCAAVREGDHYVINGSKMWTTHAHFSNRIFCLVRTKQEDRPQKGISFLLFDLDLPGITIRPIISLSGEHEFNEVFFDDVRVPVDALLGAENDGWTVAKYLLQHERSHVWSPLMRRRLIRMRKRAASLKNDGGGALIDAPWLALRLADLQSRLDVFEVLELRMLVGDAAANNLPVMPSMMKVLGSELRQELTEVANTIEGRAAWAFGVLDEEGGLAALIPASDAMRTYLNDRAASIYAGANEIQRNIIAAALLR